MQTTTLILDASHDAEPTGARAQELLESRQGVHRVLVRPERRAIYVRHSAAKAPRHALIAHLAEEGIRVTVRHR